MFTYKKATLKNLETIWHDDICCHPDDQRWDKWRDEYIAYNIEGKATTFVVLDEKKPIGQLTILFSPDCNAVKDRPFLCDGKTIANMNAFRIKKSYEGQGHISKLLKIAEEYAKKKKIKTLTIGVEAKETRNIAIYFHFGYTTFVSSMIEDDELVLYYSKKI